MGLSKKLGSSGVKRGSSALCDVDYQWSVQSYTLNEILKKFRLPRVVQSTCESCTVLWDEFQFDLKQPLLVYSKRAVSKVLARSLRFDKTKNSMVNIGPPIIIPDDYDGWFSVVSRGSEKPVRHIRVEGVAASPAKRFLVTTQLPVLVVTSGPNGEAQYVPSDVTPGEILTKIGSCDGDGVVMTHFSGSVGKSKRLLNCIDEKGDELLIPYKHKALFFEVYDPEDEASNRLMRIKHLTEVGHSFPNVVRHVFGDLPAVAYSFTGILQLETACYEETVMASTLCKHSIMPLEIKTESKVRFSIALNEVDISRTGEYSAAMSACETNGAEYVSRMKVAFKMLPVVSSLEDLNMSLYETGSDAEDVDAQSEFEIDWGPGRNSSVASSVDSVVEHQTSPDGPQLVNLSSDLGVENNRVILDEELVDCDLLNDFSDIEMDSPDLNDSGVSLKEEMV